MVKKNISEADVGIKPPLYTDGNKKPSLKPSILQLVKLNTGKSFKGEFGWSLASAENQTLYDNPYLCQ